MQTLTLQDIDRLAEQASEIIGFKSGSVVSYDVAGYDCCMREPVRPETLPTWDLSFPLGFLPHQQTDLNNAQFDYKPYPARIAGFRRRAIFGPDEIGAQIGDLKITWNDGLGNGLYESLRIDRKYGLKHTLEAPILGFYLPFLKNEWADFQILYPQIVQRWLADLKELEAVYGGPLVSSGEKMVVLWSRDYPLALFADAYARDPQGVSQELLSAIGREVPPVAPQTPQERVVLVKFWSFVRGKLARLLKYEADVIRQVLGLETILVANHHELPPLDMESQGLAYDYPAVAIRPLLLDDPVFLRHYFGYYTQLYHDLTGKPPMVSVRMNLSAATPHFVPTEALIRCWYDQAVRHGAGAFYFWTRDYPTDSAAYDGPIPGNPVLSTLPKERWQATLDTLGWLSTHQRFIPPQAEVAILVPMDSSLLHLPEWRRIYAAFSALNEACIHSCFISDRQIEQSGVPKEVRLILAPDLEFVSDDLRQSLDAFHARGGALWMGRTEVFNREGEPAAPLPGAQTFDTSLLDIFPLEQPASFSELERSANFIKRKIEDYGIDPQSWVFGITCDCLPASSQNTLREPDLDIQFEPWLYEHGSEWIMPYLRSE